MPEQKFFFESLQDTETIKTYLESLIEGIAKKKIILSTEGEDITLHPDGLLKLTVKAKKKADKNRLSIKMAWTDERIKAGDQKRTIEILS